MFSVATQNAIFKDSVIAFDIWDEILGRNCDSTCKLFCPSSLTGLCVISKMHEDTIVLVES